MYDFFVVLSKYFPIILVVKRVFDRIEECLFWFRRKLKKRLSASSRLLSNSKCIGILCVHNSAYADMAIRNANSLHYFNSEYRIYLYCDKKIKKYVLQRMRLFDYPELISFDVVGSESKVSWQALRFEALRRISLMGGALVDADSRWYASPPDTRNRVIFLTKVNEFKQNKEESDLLKRLISEKKWRGMSHYATGYAFLPKEMVTTKLFNDVELFRTRLVREIKESKLPIHLLRLSDEIALNVIVQECAGIHNISTLKSQDGPGDRKILLSYYYGCWHQISD